MAKTTTGFVQRCAIARPSGTTARSVLPLLREAEGTIHTMAKRIYVGSLPYSATVTQLEELFGQFGQVADVHLVTDRYSGQAKGFGFVEMADDQQASAAINALSGTMMGGRTLTVNEAKPREDRPRGGGGDYGSGGRW